MESLISKRYCILRTLGQGGQGSVYLALDRFHANARVALKMVVWGSGDEIDRGALSEEFLTLTRLAHPNISKVRDFAYLSRGDGAYYTSDFVNGGNLLAWAALLPRERRWPALLDIAAQGLYVLQYLFLRGVQHGDIKPANLLVERDPERQEDRPRLKIIDFGAASLKRTARAEGSVSPPGGGAGSLQRGTAAYLPPPSAREENGDRIEPDLYSFGMSLFHAGVGRLPYRLGDPGALEDWWARQKPAEPTALDPDAPATMDLLIAGLTAPRNRGCFRTPREALEWLRGRVTLPPPVRPLRGEGVTTAGRESFVEKLAAALLKPSSRNKIHVIQGPEGSGKTNVLEALEARLQVHGTRSVFFTSLTDARALLELEDLAGHVLDPSLPEQSIQAGALQLLSELKCYDVAILVDVPAGKAGAVPGEMGRARGISFFRALASHLERERGRPLLVAATDDPEALGRELEIGKGFLEIHPLEPLSFQSIQELAREFFGVEDVPEDLARLIQKESGGIPALVHEALQELGSKGVSTDFLGNLKLPRDLPARLIERSTLAAEARSVPAALKRALGLCLLADEPLSPFSAAARFPEGTADDWRGLLEGLRARGLLRREEGKDEAFYRLTGPAYSQSAAQLLGDGEERRLRESLDVYFNGLVKSSAAVPQETLLSFARNSFWLGDYPLATRWALCRSRRLLREKKRGEVLDLLLALLDSPPERFVSRGGWGSPRGRWALRLRAAEILSRLGKPDDALKVLGSEPSGQPPWYRLRACWLKIEIREEANDTSRAIEEIEGLLREAGPKSGVFVLEAKARLAQLYFRSRQPKKGRSLLCAGRDLLSTAGALERAGESAALARTFAYFARAESEYGEARFAIAFLEESLRIAKQIGRQDLAWGPLNELGIFYAREQRPADASRTFEEMEEMARKRGDNPAILRALFNRAIIHYRLNDLERAESLFREARKVSDAFGGHSLSASIWLGFAGVLRERGRLLEALRLYRRVIRPSPSVRSIDRAIAHNNIGEIYLILGRLARSWFHACQAFRLGRGTENKFLLGLSLRLRGIVRWALGASAPSRRDLLKAHELSRREKNSRALGVASHYLGRLASSRGKGAEALRWLRQGVAQSREGKDQPHLHAGMVAVMAELVKRNRRKVALRLFAAADWSKTSWGRGNLGVEVLALQLSPDWPSSLRQAVELCREAMKEGNVWEAFCVLTALLGDPALSRDERGGLSLEREVIGHWIFRRTPRKYQTSFRRFWAIASRKKPQAGGGEIAREPHENSRPSPPEVKTGRHCLLHWLEDLRKAVGARSVRLFLDPAGEEEPCFVVGQDPSGLEAILERRGWALEEAKRAASILREGPFLFLRLPHPEAKHVLCVEARGGGFTRMESVQAEILGKSPVILLALNLLAAENRLKKEKASYAEAREEIHRLNTLLVSDKENLKTALITQRFELLDLRQKLEAKSAWREAKLRAPLGSSPAMRALFERLPRVAAQELPVLILGESGVGKDLVARWIHQLSPRRERPFVAEICDIQESLMEAELFGFVKGAFTGAISDRRGIFERVGGGTIYLDEILDLALPLQARLLRVLEEKKVRPVGAEGDLAVDFRLLSSSRHAIEVLADPLRLRRDLFYRINAEIVEVPPLRERAEDIPLLVNEELKQYSDESGLPLPYVHPKALERLTEHSWPGNVRELLNEIRRVLVQKPVEVKAEMFQLDRRKTWARGEGPQKDGIPSFREERRRTEKELLLRALQAYGGNASQAARALRITRRYLGTLLEKHALVLEELKGTKAPSARKKTKAREKEKKEKGTLEKRRPKGS
jgi:DNA-binding NtrC family response regulator/serine/threonine protein kinase/tetratricopeptide (TPR) repeat protein